MICRVKIGATVQHETLVHAAGPLSCARPCVLLATHAQARDLAHTRAPIIDAALRSCFASLIFCQQRWKQSLPVEDRVSALILTDGKAHDPLLLAWTGEQDAVSVPCALCSFVPDVQQYDQHGGQAKIGARKQGFYRSTQSVISREAEPGQTTRVISIVSHESGHMVVIDDGSALRQNLDAGSPASRRYYQWSHARMRYLFPCRAEGEEMCLISQEERSSQERVLRADMAQKAFSGSEASCAASILAPERWGWDTTHSVRIS